MHANTDYAPYVRVATDKANDDVVHVNSGLCHVIVAFVAKNVHSLHCFSVCPVEGEIQFAGVWIKPADQ